MRKIVSQILLIAVISCAYANLMAETHDKYTNNKVGTLDFYDIKDFNEDGIVDLYDAVFYSAGNRCLAEVTSADVNTIENANISYTLPNEIEVGQEFDIRINVENVQDLYGASLDLNFDNSIIQIQALQKGEVFNEDVLIPVNKVNGNMASIVMLQKGNIPGVVVSENKTLIIIKAKAVGTGLLNLGDNVVIKLANSNAKPINYQKQNVAIQVANPIIDVAKEVKVIIPTFNVTINREKIDNSTSKYPLITYNDVTYIPMTWAYCQSLGLLSEYTHENGFKLQQTGKSIPLEQDLTGNNQLGAEYIATTPTYKVYVNGRRIDNSKEQYPILNFRDITYFPLTWNFMVEEFGWQTKWDDRRGLYISAIGEIEVPVQSITLNKQSLKMEINQTEKLEAHILPTYAYNQDVIWESDNKNVAVVNNQGQVTAVGEGTAIITARTKDGNYTSNCKVRVFLEMNEKVQVTIPPFKIVVNQQQINNQKSTYPMIFYKDITYVPMTWDYCLGLGLSSSYTDEEGLMISQRENSDTLVVDYKGNNDLTAIYEAVKPVYDIRVNGKEIDNAQEVFPLLNFRDITYFPLTWRFTVEEFGWRSYFDQDQGLVINSNR